MNPKVSNMDEVYQYWIDEAEDALTVLDHLFDKVELLVRAFLRSSGNRKDAQRPICNGQERACAANSQPSTSGTPG